MKARNKLLILFAGLFFLLLLSCADKDNSQSISSYNPNDPVEAISFYPDTGGIASKIILNGRNFGNDPSLISLYFNKKKAAVIDARGDKIYALAPKLPGDTCVISIKIGNDSVVFAKHFYYRKKYNVITIAGKPGTTEFIEGALASAQFGDLVYVTVDKDNNVFACQRNEISPPVCSRINEAENSVTYLFTEASNQPLNVPTVDEQTQNVFVPSDAGYDYYEMSPANMWIARRRAILRPSAEQQAAGMTDFTINWKHAFAFCRADGLIYTRSYDGQLIKFDPVTRVGERVTYTDIRDSDSFLIFDPVNPNILYISYTSKHCIYSYNIKTKEQKLFAGFNGQAGWNDGVVLDAEFNKPRQLALDKEGNMFVADEGNHCIRMISPEGIVTTVIGIAGKSGYLDGDVEVALLKSPRGVSVDSNGDVYIGDYGNRCIRKLSLQ